MSPGGRGGCRDCPCRDRIRHPCRDRIRRPCRDRIRRTCRDRIRRRRRRRRMVRSRRGVRAGRAGPCPRLLLRLPAILAEVYAARASHDVGAVHRLHRRRRRGRVGEGDEAETPGPAGLPVGDDLTGEEGRGTERIRVHVGILDDHRSDAHLAVGDVAEVAERVRDCALVGLVGQISDHDAVTRHGERLDMSRGGGPLCARRQTILVLEKRVGPRSHTQSREGSRSTFNTGVA